VSVYSEVGGELTKVLVEEGESVKAGQVVAQIDDEELQAACARSKAALAVRRARAAQTNAPARPEELHKARTQLEEARVRMKNAEADLARQKRLFKRDVSSREFLDNASMSFAAAEARFNVAKANLELVEKGARDEERAVLAAEVKEAEALVRQAELRLEKATIKAPITGIVDKRYLDQGAYVDTDDPIFRIVDMHTVKVLASVPERDIAAVRPGLRVDLEVDAHPGRVFAGTVRRISPTVAADSRTAEAEVAIPNEKLLLKPGMFSRLRIILGEKQKAMVVPSDAVLDREGETYVYVVEDGKARRRPVTVGLSQDSITEVEAGIAEGEQVVSFGLLMLKDGMGVVVRNGAGSSAPDRSGETP